jgi:radical SAM/Cys-rich protein
MPAVRVRLPIAARKAPDFASTLAARSVTLRRARTTTLQINVGKVCNQACHHCHVEAGPVRTETMSRAVAERVIELLAASPAVTTLDITGGAPELNPQFRWIVDQARALGRHVIDRCNLTILFEPGMADLAAFLADREVEIVASLPCYSERQRRRAARSRGVRPEHRGAPAPSTRSATAHRRARTLNLVYNPNGAFLPPAQARARGHVQASSAARLRQSSSTTSSRSPTCRSHATRTTSMRARRVRGVREPAGESHLNPATVPGHVMCRSLRERRLGRPVIYDCDFNQMLELPLPAARTIFELASLDARRSRRSRRGRTASAARPAAGSSCGGSLDVTRAGDRRARRERLLRSSRGDRAR